MNGESFSGGLGRETEGLGNGTSFFFMEGISEDFWIDEKGMGSSCASSSFQKARSIKGWVMD